MLENCKLTMDKHAILRLVNIPLLLKLVQNESLFELSESAFSIEALLILIFFSFRLKRGGLLRFEPLLVLERRDSLC